MYLSFTMCRNSYPAQAMKVRETVRHLSGIGIVQGESREQVDNGHRLHSHKNVGGGMNRGGITASEVQELQRCNRDLTSMLELAVHWRGLDAASVAESLLDILLGMLDIDIVYVRLERPERQFVRVGSALCSSLGGDEVLEELAPLLAAEAEPSPSGVLVGGIRLFISRLPLGIAAEAGSLVVGSRRACFPRETEWLRLSVAANQASLALREVLEPPDSAPCTDARQPRAPEASPSRTNDALDLIINSVPAMVWSTTADGMADFFNQHHLDYVGNTFEELAGLGFLSQFHPDDLPGLLATWEAMMASKVGGNLEGRVRRADGDYRWVLMRAAPMLDPAGEVIKWCGVNTDIEDRKRAEDALRATEEALSASERNARLMIDSLPVLVWASREDGSADFVNKQYLDYVGLRADEVLEWGYLNIWHPDDVERMKSAWTAQLGADTATNQGRIRRFDGTYRWFYFAGQKFIDASGDVRWFGVSLDIEDVKRAQDALRASEAALQRSDYNLRQIIDTIPGLAWSSDTEGEATFVNKHYLDYIGMTFEEARGTGWATTIHPDDAERCLASWHSMLKTGRGGDFEGRLRGADGNYRWFLFRASPLRDEAGNLVQWFGVNTDIEERKCAEEELRESQAELARVARIITVGELALSIAHEVNQPLMAIVTNAGTCLRWLGEDQLDVSEARQAASRIVRDGHRAGEIIAGIRALAQKSPPKLLPMDLEQAMREVLELLRGELYSRGIEPTIHYSGQTITVIGDQTQLQQVMLNLIMNSVEAMTDAACDQRRLVIACSAHSDRLAQVSVSDNGIGLDPVTTDRLFDAFFTTKPSGIGIGLSICRSIVEAHGGRIWASRNEPEGSVFSFTVRLAAKGDRDQGGPGMWPARAAAAAS